MTEGLIIILFKGFSFEGTLEIFVGKFSHSTLALSRGSLVDLSLLSDTLALVLFLLPHKLSKHSNFVTLVLSKIKTKALGRADLQQVVVERLSGNAHFRGSILKR